MLMSDRQINSLILNREIDLLYVVNGDEKNEHIGVVSTGFMKLANTMQVPIITNKQSTDKDYLDWITKLTKKNNPKGLMFRIISYRRFVTL